MAWLARPEKSLYWWSPSYHECYSGSKGLEFYVHSYWKLENVTAGSSCLFCCQPVYLDACFNRLQVPRKDTLINWIIWNLNYLLPEFEWKASTVKHFSPKITRSFLSTLEVGGRLWSWRGRGGDVYIWEWCAVFSKEKQSLVYGVFSCGSMICISWECQT